MEYTLEHSGRMEALRGCPSCLDPEPFQPPSRWGVRPPPSSTAAAATASSSPSWVHSGGPLYSSGGGGGSTGASGHADSPHGLASQRGCAASSSPTHICCVCSGLLSHATCLRLLRGITRRLRGYRELWEGASSALLAEGLQYDATQGQVRIRDFSRWSRLSHPSAVPAASSGGNAVRRSRTEPGEGCSPV